VLRQQKNRYLEVLKWARENGCPWGKQICADAAWGGSLEILKWLRENGCPWDEKTCSVAASKGYFEALRAALARNIEMGKRE
jgi:hypothetical protein